MGSCATVVCTLLITGLITALPIGMICVGVAHYDSCPMEEYVPLYMIVTGSAGLLIIVLILTVVATQKNDSCLVTLLNIFLAIVMFFKFAWSIVGSVWVFRKWAYWDDLDRKVSPVEGCDPNLYLFAFVYLITYWVLFPFTYGGVIKTAEIRRQGTTTTTYV